MVWQQNGGQVSGQGASDEAVAILLLSSVAGAEDPHIQVTMDGLAKATNKSIDNGGYVESRRDAGVRERGPSSVHRLRRSSLYQRSPRVARYKSHYRMRCTGSETRLNKPA
jgi:hypothetical protein